jgi:hypothetical protein
MRALICACTLPVALQRLCSTQPLIIFLIEMLFDSRLSPDVLELLCILLSEREGRQRFCALFPASANIPSLTNRLTGLLNLSLRPSAVGIDGKADVLRLLALHALTVLFSGEEGCEFLYDLPSPPTLLFALAMVTLGVPSARPVTIGALRELRDRADRAAMPGVAALVFPLRDGFLLRETPKPLLRTSIWTRRRCVLANDYLYIFSPSCGLGGDLMSLQ